MPWSGEAFLWSDTDLFLLISLHLHALPSLSRFLCQPWQSCALCAVDIAPSTRKERALQQTEADTACRTATEAQLKTLDVRGLFTHLMASSSRALWDTDTLVVRAHFHMMLPKQDASAFPGP